MNLKKFTCYISSVLFLLIGLAVKPLSAQVKPSTDEQSYWYFLVSSSNLGYCKGKVVYNCSALPHRTLRFGDKTLDGNAIWKFVKVGETGYHIINHATGLYMKSTSNGQKSGEVTSTDKASEATVFHIENQGNYSYLFIGENQNPIHAQEYAGFMVTWNDKKAGSASSWRPERVTETELAKIEAKEASDKTDYSLVWADDFNDDQENLENNWNFSEGFVRNQEHQWYQRQNASIQDGCLVIEGKREHFKNPNYVPGDKDWRKNREFVDYTSSCLTSSNRFDFTYGRLEVRAQIPTSAGSWPAIWTLGYEGQGDFHWPSSGEVDLMEFYKNQTLSNLVWGGNKNTWHSIWESRVCPMNYWNGIDRNWKNQFHTWRMDWDSESIKLYLDDELITICNLNRTINAFGSAKGTNPFRDKAQYVLLNLAMGGESAGPIDNSAFPLKYSVDYVHLYQKPGQHFRVKGEEVITGISHPETTSSEWFTLQPEHITVKGKVGQVVALYALNGTRIQQTKLNGTTAYLTTSQLPKGVYLLQLSGQGVRQQAKVIL